ncbi:MAG TPA: IS5 family transposase [Gemmataceae bacterium]|jgi:transposase|nr:IS5 family transposase [Gemmataceae bacterium]
MHRYELTDAQWECIAPFFPDRYHDDQPGHPWWTHRRLVNGILWHLHTGAPWRDLPERYGPWQTVYDRFNRWRQDGTWAKILDALLLRLDKAGVIDRDLWLVDASVIRATRAAAGAKKKSGRAAALGRTRVNASARASRPCAGPLARRLWHEGPLGLRRPRHRAGGVGHPGPAS